MNKIYTIILIFILSSCSFLNNERSVFLQNNQGQSIYVKICNESANKLAFILHGLASDMNHQVVETAKNAFLDNGYTVVTFDARYSLGESYGNVSNVSLSTFLEDLETVVNWAKKQDFYHEPYAIAGHSLGGATAILYSHNNDNISFLIPIAPVTGGLQWENSCMKNMPDFCKQWKEKGYYEYTQNDKSVNIFYTVVEDAKSYNVLELAQNIKAPTLFIIAEKDRVIEEKDVQKVADLMKAKIAKISQSTHNFVKKQNQDDLYTAIYDFIK
jgi:alpha-beta hydrolase superfamily lysophospholipase